MKIMVLNDGETFTSLNGCKIVEVYDGLTDDEIEEYLKNINHQPKNHNMKVITTFKDNGMEFSIIGITGDHKIRH